MWMYFLVFVATLVVDSIPIFAPPAWTVLVLLLLLFHLNPWIVVIIGVTGSTLGRYILSVYIPKVSSSLVNRREDENLRYVGGKLTKAPFAAAIFVFLYTLTATFHDGSLYGRGHRTRQALAHFTALLLRNIDHGWRDGLHRQIRG